MQASGFYHAVDTKAPHAYRNFNTWIGDPARAYQLKTTIEVIHEEKLIDLAATTGAHLHAGLRDLAKRYPHVYSRPRGQGTYGAIDCATPEQRDAMMVALRQMGLAMAVCARFPSPRTHTLSLLPLVLVLIFPSV